MSRPVALEQLYLLRTKPLVQISRAMLWFTVPGLPPVMDLTQSKTIRPCLTTGTTLRVGIRQATVMDFAPSMAAAS